MKNNKVLQSSEMIVGITGLLGAMILIQLEKDPFKLYFINGYLLLATLFICVFVALKIDRYADQKNKSYWKRVCFGMSTYFAVLLFSTIYAYIIRYDFQINWSDLPLLFSLHLGLSLVISMVCAIRLIKKKEK